MPARGPPQSGLDAAAPSNPHRYSTSLAGPCSAPLRTDSSLSFSRPAAFVALT
jgi:hypothetical protein